MGLNETSFRNSLTPPQCADDWLDWICLLRSRHVGCATFYRLMGEYGGARAALDALPDLARAQGARDYVPATREAARAEIASGKRIGARLLAIGMPAYPDALAQIPDPPPILWTLGERDVLNQPLVGVVGARNASSLGLRTARAMARGLGEPGICVVSGLARGIDAAAHEAALPTGTIAVLAGGLDRPAPPENRDLARRIAAEGGLLLTEQPMGLEPRAREFPRRNRIVSGLSRGVVVVEAAQKSGSLITARFALEQGREVLAVPGHPFDARASGCNALIRDGAALVRGPRDVIEALALDAEPVPPPSPVPERTTASPASAPVAGPLDRAILERLGPSPVQEDQLLADLGRPVAEVLAALQTLELDDRIARAPGNMLTRIV